MRWDKTDRVRVARVIIYEGPRGWVDITLKKGGVPANGEAPFLDEGYSIKSSTVELEPEVSA